MFAQPFLSIYGVTVFQMENLPRNGRFCTFDLHFGQIVNLFAALKDPSTYLCRRVKYISSIVLFAQTPFWSIYGVTVFQIENWPQN